MTGDSFASRLSQAMKNSGMRAAQVANACGISRSTLSQYMAGRYAAKYDRIESLAKCLGCDARWLAGFASDDAQSNTLPVISSLAAKELLARGNILRREFAPPEYCGGGHFIFIVRDDSMAPILPQGDAVVCRAVGVLTSGDTGLFVLDGKRELVRRYFCENGRTKLACANPDWLPVYIGGDESDRLRVLGQVVLSSRRWCS